MDFNEAKAYLASALTFGIKLGLHRMNRLMDLLGHPEKNLRCIHIAGTNGKGSVTTFCSAILASAGLKVGVYTSPYLERLTERVRVLDGPAGLSALIADEAAGEIGPQALSDALTLVQAAVSQMLAEGDEHPTEFELITAVGFLHFSKCRCDVVILETGLGGRLDSTNVVEAPLACVITALGFDHMDRLGSTMSEIAMEKAGIIKPGRPVFLYDPADLRLSQSDITAAGTVIREKCRQLAAPLDITSQSELELLDYGWSGQTFIDRRLNMRLHTRLLGIFQPQNAALAARVCKALGLASDQAIQAGIEAARWPARLELLRRDPPILLDGAHNPQGCQALADALARLLPGKPVVFLAGMLQDKDYQGMLRLVLDRAEYTPVAFVCVTPDNPRALPAARLAASIREAGPRLHKEAESGYNNLDAIYIADQPEDGARLALQLATQGNLALCAFGSLYMAGRIRQTLAFQEDIN